MNNDNESAAHPTRRDTLRAGLIGGASLMLGGVMGGVNAWAGPTTAPTSKPASKGVARTIIQIWMWGGPAQTDTFDPKPEAGTAYCGPLDKPIETNVPGMRIGSLLPLLAKHADKYSIIRSMTHGNNGHETASYLMQTGHRPGRTVCPSIGAVVSKLRGYEAGYKGFAPPYIVLTTPQGRFSEAGCLGNQYKPFSTGGDPNKAQFVVEGIVAEGISDDRQHARRKLLGDLDTLGKAMSGHDGFGQFDDAGDEAYATLFGPARELFDLAKEDVAIRDAYGRNTFGQSCLMARRLAEAGVPYVTINYGGWDTHKQHFQTMNRKLPEMDQAMATLLQDLTDRGLLASTIVWWGGEFGRSPKVQFEPPWNGGRNHFGRCFSVLLAGGGFEGGHVIGETDPRGESVKSRPVYPRDLIGSLYTRMGIDPTGPMPGEREVKLPLLPPAEPEETDGGLLKEIMPT